MRITIIGGAGFVGGLVASSLTAEGHTVRVLDRTVQTQDAQEAQEAHSILRVRASIEHAEAMTEAVVDSRPDVVVNLAYLVGPPAEISISRATQVNVVGQQNCMDAVARSVARRYVYASSIAVYGPGPDVSPSTEPAAVPLLHHATNYAATKSTNEFQARAFATETGIETCGLRISIVTGAGRSHGLTTWSSEVVDQVAEGRRTIQVPVAKSLRSNLIDVNDVARLVAMAVEFRGELSPLYNSGGDDLSAEQLAAALGEIEPTAEFEFAEHPTEQPFVHNISSDLVTRDLGFERTPLQQSLRRHMDQYRESQGLAPRYCRGE